MLYLADELESDVAIIVLLNEDPVWYTCAKSSPCDRRVPSCVKKIVNVPLSETYHPIVLQSDG